MWIWYLDRGAALVAYTALWLAALTGVLYNAKRFGWLHRALRRVHVPVSVIAVAALLLHVVVGTYDAWLVLARLVPHPAYSDTWFLAGLVVGVSALLLTVTSVLAFLDPRRFERPWDPRAVHALAYGGFVFSSIHAAAVGSDLSTFVGTGLIAATVLVVVLLVVRFTVEGLASPVAAR